MAEVKKEKVKDKGEFSSYCVLCPFIDSDNYYCLKYNKPVNAKLTPCGARYVEVERDGKIGFHYEDKQ